MSKEQSPIIPRVPHSNFRAALLFTAASLLLLALAHLVVAAGFLASNSEATVFTQMARWQTLQQFVGIIALLLLILTDDHPTTPIARSLLILPLFAILAITLEILGLPNAGIGLIIAVLLLALRQMLALSGSSITIEKLWRIIAVQWLLLWAGADAYLRFKHNPADPGSSARSLLFLLPALALLPNLLMSITIHFFSTLNLAPQKPRLRAWLLALLLLNAGALLAITSHPFLNILGLPLMLLAIPLFLLGFPKNSFRSTSLLLPLSFLLLFLALAMLLLERLKSASSSDPIPFFYSESWRHLLFATPILWLLSLGQIAHKTLLPKKRQSPTLALLIPLLYLTASLLTAAFLLSAIYSHDLTQLLLLSTTLQLLPLLLALPLTLRSLRAIRQS